jgi:hypothetical protein
MYPWELIADILESADSTLKTTALDIIKWLVFITKHEYAYFSVPTESPNIGVSV